MIELDLSVVVPVYNEVAVVDELVRRCQAAASVASDRWELIVVDDLSTDGTSVRLEALAVDESVRHLRLPENMGQFRATCEGLRVTHGRIVVVLDGDLQDPPECIPDMVAQIQSLRGMNVAVFAVKTARSESLAFRFGRWVYGALSSVAAWSLPPGAGAYCAMPGALARRIPRVPADHANLAPFVAAASDRIFVVPYEKAPRYDAQSRVGLPGLIREGLSTLQYNGSLERIVWVWAAGLAVSQVWGGAVIGFGIGLGLRRRRVALEARLRE